MQNLENYPSNSESEEHSDDFSPKLDKGRIKSLKNDSSKILKFEHDEQLSSEQNYSDAEQNQSNINDIFKKSDKKTNRKREELTIQKEVDKSKYEIRELKLQFIRKYWVLFNLFAAFLWAYDQGQWIEYFNTSAIVLYSMGVFLIIIMIMSTAYSYWKKIAALKIAMISLAFFVFFPQLKRQEFLNQEMPDGMKTDENSGQSKVLGVIQPTMKVCYIIFHNYLMYETIEGNLMLIIMTSFQLALIAIYFDNLPFEEALSFECIKWLVGYNAIMLPMQYFGLQCLYKKFVMLQFKAMVSKKIQSYRYKRICDTVQEGILILKGFKIIFINGIFQNLSILNNLKPKYIQDGETSPSYGYLNQKIFYLYAMQDDKNDFENENDEQNSDEFKLHKNHINGTKPLYLHEILKINRAHLS